MLGYLARKAAGASTIGLLALASAACAGDTPALESAAATGATDTVSEATGQNGPALWVVADEDTRIYLFGTIHALPESIEWMDEDISTALKASDTLVTEVDMASMAGPEMVRIIQTTAVLPQGTTLRSLLSPEQLETYEAAMERIGYPISGLDRFEPWYAGIMLAMVPLQQRGYSSESGVEKVLLQYAGEIDKAALETPDFQLGVFDQLPPESQIQFLIEAAENVEDITPYLDAMVAVWLEGDAEALAGKMNEGLTDAALAEALLFKRNETWAEWIDTRLDSPGTVFMAVGAGHLAGKRSVQDYLEERGFKVTRIQ